MKRIKRAVARIGWKKLGIGALIALPVLMIAAQFIYPLNNTMPYASVDGIALGAMSYDDANDLVKRSYDEKQLDIYFGEAEAPYRSPTLNDLGVSVASDELVARAAYPWWLRLVPTSIWWAHTTIDQDGEGAKLGQDQVKDYVEKELGDSCKVEPKNASLTVKDDAITLVPSEDGGRCDIEDVIERIAAKKPIVATENIVRVPVERIAPAISDTDARTFKDTIDDRLTDTIDITFGKTHDSLEARDVRQWLAFSNKGKKLTAKIDAKKAKKTLQAGIGKKVARQAGVVTIKTHDFVEVSRSGGPDGREIDVTKTAQNIAKYLMKQKDEVTVAVRIIPAQKKYQRSYSATHTGLSALMKHYADQHKGVYGVSLIELSGQRRRASYNDTKKFTTASTYKAYVAYSTLRRIDNGTLTWSDQIAGGRNLTKCFDDMIVLSDNPCAEALVKKIGYNAIHADVQSLGLTNTSFIDAESFKTTAGDLSTFMASLESGQLPLKKASRSTFINALKRNVYRQGIPAGVSGTVADKVGFLEGLLHDTAIVYGAGGTYVLTIMTDGSTWGNIADLTREIQKLRTK